MEESKTIGEEVQETSSYKLEKIIVRGTTIMTDIYGPHERRFTIVGLLDDQELRIGLATCSDKDAFNKKVGNKIAAFRAINRPIAVLDVGNLPKAAEDSSIKRDAVGVLCQIRDSISESPHLYHKPYKMYEVSTQLG